MNALASRGSEQRQADPGGARVLEGVVELLDLARQQALGRCVAAPQQPEVLLLADVGQVPDQGAHQRAVLRGQLGLVEVGEPQRAGARGLEPAGGGLGGRPGQRLRHGLPPRARRVARPRSMARRSSALGLLPETISSAKPSTSAFSDGGQCRAASSTQPVTARRIASSCTAVPGGGLPAVGHRRAQLGGGVGGHRVVEQRDRDRGERRPPPVGHRVEAAQLEVAARPDGREQRGQVVVEVGHRRPAPERCPATQPLGEGNPLGDGQQPVAVAHQHHRRVQGVRRPRRGRLPRRHRIAAAVVDALPGALAHRVPPARRSRRATARSKTRRRASGPSSAPGPTWPPSPSAGPASRLTWSAEVAAIISSTRPCAAESVEVLLHRVVARARVDPTDRPGQVAAERGGTEAGTAQLRAQRLAVGAERGHRRDEVGSRWRGQLDLSARLECHRAAGGHRAESVGQGAHLVPVRSSLRTGQVDEVELQLQADATAAVGHQGGLGDVLPCRRQGIGRGEQRVLGSVVGRDVPCVGHLVACARARMHGSRPLSGHPPLQVRTGCRGSRGSVRGDRQAVLVVLRSRLAHGTDKPNPARSRTTQADARARQSRSTDSSVRSTWGLSRR